MREQDPHLPQAAAGGAAVGLVPQEGQQRVQAGDLGGARPRRRRPRHHPPGMKLTAGTLSATHTVVQE
jgi:hypothetical protein